MSGEPDRPTRRDRLSNRRDAAIDRLAERRDSAAGRVADARDAAAEHLADAREVASEHLADAKAAAADLLAKRPKPRLRGVSHQWAFFVSLVLGAALILLAGAAEARVAVAIYAVSLSAVFGVSALYHRVTWRRPEIRLWMRRLDHAMIYVLIAGTYTPFALLALEGAWRWTVLAIVWAGATVAIVLKFAWVTSPKWLSAGLGIALGWAGIVVLPKLFGAIGITGTILLAAGGLLYTSGAIVYALRRPDPAPATFGYHEVFHACVIGAAACQYAVVALLVAS